MKVFISWSGDRSKTLAIALRAWLQPILQSVTVWMSEADIDAGDRWGQEVATELSSSNFGIICVTPENLTSPWLLFEAGALAKSLDGAKVIPLLFDLELRDISGPLAQFQAKKFEHDGLADVAIAINKSLTVPLQDDSLKSLLGAMWPGLQQGIQAVPRREGDVKSVRKQADVLEELVSVVRGFDSRLRETEIMSSEPKRYKTRRTRFHLPMILDMLPSFNRNDPLGLLVIAGAIREDAPWISEVLTEAYRDIRRGNLRHLGELPDRIHQLTRMFRVGFLEELGSNKDQQRFIEELPHIVDHYLRSINLERSSSLLRKSKKLEVEPIPIEP